MADDGEEGYASGTAYDSSGDERCTFGMIMSIQDNHIPAPSSSVVTVDIAWDAFLLAKSQTILPRSVFQIVENFLDA